MYAFFKIKDAGVIPITKEIFFIYYRKPKSFSLSLSIVPLNLHGILASPPSFQNHRRHRHSLRYKSAIDNNHHHSRLQACVGCFTIAGTGMSSELAIPD
ncbi:hypothetical protein L1887_35256 [Cichorium endivia]|nr:hypothetical protein L1887_35256 [Cichorium endivia]